MHKFSNDLIHESSPYLLEHSHNPVNWYPWGEKAFEIAKKENKPVIISIGYNACHWCHVMEHESYSDVDVAEYMNEYFVSVKVDREERPDVDQIYMSAVMLISGNGGWPLNAFVLPDGRPFYALTYCSKSQWLNLLEQIVSVYNGKYDDLVNQADNITNGIKSIDNFIITDNVQESNEYTNDDYDGIFKSWEQHIDFESGGFTGTPKFPLPVFWELLLQYYHLTGNTISLNAVIITLDKMLMGGINDHAGGGFARYSTDENWRVPHFEKMLYDNGQLISLYAHAYQITGYKHFAEIITETLDFIKNEMTHTGGGFYSSINADSEGEEGKFYTWTLNEFELIFNREDFILFSDYFNLEQKGNWENNRNILYIIEKKEAFALKNGINPEKFNQLYKLSRDKILNERNKRIRPTTDYKILTAWNAIMLKAFLDAYRALDDIQYLESAISNADFLERNMFMDDGMVMRNYTDGKITIPAFLDDYAFVAEAFIELYKVTFNIQWLVKARSVTDFTIQHFYDPVIKMFYYSSDNTKLLITRKVELQDNVISSSNSVTAKNLYYLGVYFNYPKYIKMSGDMIRQIKDNILTQGPYYANWAFLLGLLVHKPFEIAIIGDDSLLFNKQLQQNYLPDCIIMGGNEENLPFLEKKKIEGKTLIYICKNNTCYLTCENVEDALNFLNIN